MTLVLIIIGLHLAICFASVFTSAAINAVARGEPIRFSREWVSYLLREWAAVTMCIPLLALGRGPGAPRLSQMPATSHPPVLLVPGYGLNRSSLWFLGRFLEYRGWNWTWSTSLRQRDATIPKMAAELMDAIQKLRQITGADRIQVVGHSMGGIVASYAINQLDGAQYVERLVTLGTPWRGSDMHIFGVGRIAREMAPSSAVLTELSASSVPLTAIWSWEDAVVCPPENAQPLEHEDTQDAPSVQSICIPKLGHMEMLLSVRVHRAVADALSQPSTPTKNEPDSP